jgi:hypothetical protein
MKNISEVRRQNVIAKLYSSFSAELSTSQFFVLTFGFLHMVSEIQHIVHFDFSSGLTLLVVIQRQTRQKRDIRANHKCKPNLARPKAQRFFNFQELKAKFDFVNIQRVNQNSFFLKI